LIDVFEKGCAARHTNPSEHEIPAESGSEGDSNRFPQSSPRFQAAVAISAFIVVPRMTSPRGVVQMLSGLRLPHATDNRTEKICSRTILSFELGSVPFAATSSSNSSRAENINKRTPSGCNHVDERSALTNRQSLD
jgi:hypothetical protein